MEVDVDRDDVEQEARQRRIPKDAEDLRIADVSKIDVHQVVVEDDAKVLVFPESRRLSALETPAESSIITPLVSNRQAWPRMLALLRFVAMPFSVIVGQNSVVSRFDSV